MLGKSHALSGAVGWVAGSSLLAMAGHAPPGSVVLLGAVVSTGFALLPDVDHPGSTVSRTLGPITGLLSAGVAGGAAALRRSSCAHCAGIADRGGHRAVTHTAVFAVTLGLIVAVLGWVFGTAAISAVVGFGAWLAAHTALSSKWRARIGDMVLPGKFRFHNRSAHRITAAVGALLVAVGFAGVAANDAGVGWWWLGLAVFWGCLAHDLGDSLTLSGCPLMWPLQVRGCRWTSVGTPRWMRFRTGSRVEAVVVGLLTAAGVGALYVLGSVPA